MLETRERKMFPEEELNIKKYLHLIYTRRWALLSVIAFVMLLDIIYTFKQTPIYRATSLVLIEKPIASLAASNPREAVTADIGRGLDYYYTQYEILRSRTLARRVVKALNLTTISEFQAESPEDVLKNMIVVDGIRNSRLVNVSVNYRDPLMATKIVNALVGLYIEQNVESMLFMSKEILRAFPEDAKEIERHTVYGQLKDVSKEELADSLPSVVNNSVVQKLKTDKIEIEADLANLAKRYKPKHPKMAALNSKLKFIENKIEMEKSKILSSLRADLAGRLQANNIRVIDYAKVPKTPIKPKPLKNMMAGFLFSVFLGIGLILLMDFMDDTVKTQDDLENMLGVPYLGDFPQLKDLSIATRASTMRLEELDKNIEASEAIRNIRTSIIFSAPKDELKTILLTSTLPKEGKSFMASYIGYSLAKNGIRTLILDSDIRKPRMHKIFGVDQSPGLVNLLVEDTPIDQAIRKTPYNNLYILPSGSKTPNPLELLSSDRMKNILRELSERFEKIVIDTPPSFNISDALVMSRLSTANIFVAKSGVVSREVLDKIMARFRETGSRITGAIINFSEIGKTSYYKYKYYRKYYKSYYSVSEKDLGSHEERETIIAK